MPSYSGNFQLILERLAVITITANYNGLPVTQPRLIRYPLQSGLPIIIKYVLTIFAIVDRTVYNLYVPLILCLTRKFRFCLLSLSSALVRPTSELDIKRPSNSKTLRELNVKELVFCSLSIVEFITSIILEIVMARYSYHS